MFSNFSKRSIRRNFLIQLLISLASMIIIFSSFLYFYIEKSIYDEKRYELLQYAKNIVNNKAIMDKDDYFFAENLISLNIEVVYLKSENIDIDAYITTLDKHSYLTLFYPFNIEDKSYLKVKKDITQTVTLLDKILHYIFIINIVGFILVVIYAIALSKMLVTPLTILSAKLSNMNEHLMKPIKIEELPQEF
ncbi:MAG: sensor histidine kinase, partial [Campylobacterota bacterium]|nr:sensor histidine kinase [Campylobacterota bacterium]